MGQIPQTTYKSLRPLHNALIRRVPRGYGRHHSPCACTASNQLQTNRTRSAHAKAAGMGRSWPWLDVEPRVERPLDKHKIDAMRPTGERRQLHEFGILELLGHGRSQPTQTRQPKAENTCRSKLPVAGHDIWPHQRLRGHARRLEAHGMRKPLTRHGKALPAARTYVWDINLVVGFNRRARI